MTRSDSPTLSVVVPSVNGWQDLRACLEAIDLAGRSIPLEVIVPERCGARERAELSRHFPAVRVIPVAPDTSIPRMRALAFGAAAAPTVAVIEDHILVKSTWACRIEELRAAGHRVIGGRVENAATERAVDCAAFLCEYHGVLRVRAAGVAQSLIGNCTAYDRKLLRHFEHVIDRGGWEDSLHDAMQTAGVELWYDPTLVVRHRRVYHSASEYARERFNFSRAWAAMHTASSGSGRRLWLGARAALLPPLLLFRILTYTWSQRTNRMALLRSLPFLPLFIGSWALGELVGTWSGDGGALAKVR